MPASTTPGVYVREIKVFPPSVAEVETAIPAFIGYTATATRDTANDLLLKPTKIFSMTEFEHFFGGPPVQPLAVTVTTRTDGGKDSELLPTPSPAPNYLLHHSMKMFFDNGGGQCYVVAVGPYKAAAPFIDVNDLTAGLTRIRSEDEPTLLLIPESVKLAYGEYGTLVSAMLLQCFDLGDRFAILDPIGGDVAPGVDIPTPGLTPPNTEVIAANRGAWVGDIDKLKYGAAYYPFIKTSMNPPVDETLVNVAIDGQAAVTLASLKNTQTESYNAAKAALTRTFLVLPPSGAVAGVYAYTDTSRGVWKAPANVPLNDVLEPTVKLDEERQGPLNVDPTTGKSINALRAFAGKGTLVWGARTLAGNDNEWRYVNVRRFFNMVEESVKKSTYWAVFESNDANTWVKVRGMVESYLTQKWREGALAGATPKDAFFVRCGLGTTMDAQDILEGRMNVEIGMAVVRPAEFIILKFSHKMQVS
jgi:phage tail sheath protein FI